MQVPTEINAPKSFKKNSQFAFCRSKGNAFLFSVSSKSVKFHGLLLQYFLNSSKKKKERNIRDHFVIRNLLKNCCVPIKVLNVQIQKKISEFPPKSTSQIRLKMKKIK